MIFMSLAAIQGDALLFRAFVAVVFIGMIAALMYDLLRGGKYEFYRSEMRWRMSMFGGSGIQKPPGSLVFGAFVTDVLGARPLMECRSETGRWSSHLMMEWGFLLTVLVAVIRFFFYPAFAPLAPLNPLAVISNLGFAMMLLGLLWYLFLRVNVVYERNSVTRFTPADRFLFGMFAYSATAVLYEVVYYISPGGFSFIFMILYALGTFYFFLSAPWSKFSHIFYKGAYNVQQRILQSQGLVHTPPPASVSYIKRRE
jgi:hypothetical protein